MKSEAFSPQQTPKRTAQGSILNAMSVDVEEYFQVGAFESCINPSDWDHLASRVDYNTRLVLDLYQEAGIKATFFTLGWVAQRHPSLMKEIAARGHEIASHGYKHDRVHTLTPAQFTSDIDLTKAILEDTSGCPVRGYRAPSFSIGERQHWALEILAAKGYAYSSSVYPIAHDHYGWPSAPRFAFRPFADSTFIEIPVTTIRAFGRSFAAGGGGFFRLLPYSISKWAINQVNTREQASAIFYFHPWEVDPLQPVQRHAPLKSRIRHYTNLSQMAAKLKAVMQDFAWGRVDEVFLKTSPTSLTEVRVAS